MSVTIKDVARLAGVSIASVSRVMHDQPGVSKKTAEKIRRVMEECGYRPNLGARQLVKQITGNIAIIFPRSSSFILGNPFFTRVLEGISIELDRTDFTAIFSFTSQQQKRILETHLVDGVILFAPRENEIDMNWFKQTKYPTVVVGSYSGEPDFPVVRPDDTGGIYLAVQSLYELGHKNIALVNGPLESMKSIRCLQGYKNAISDLGLQFNEKYAIEISEFDAVRAFEKMYQVLKDSPDITGVVCVADYLAMGVMKAANSLNLSIPTDLSIIGFGDKQVAEYFIPPLSTVQVELTKIGQKAAQILTDLIDGKQIRKKERVFEMEFVSRGTSDKPKKTN